MYKKWYWYVYILELYNSYYYTGVTWKPEVRMEQHFAHMGSKYTTKHGVKRLVYLEEHEDIDMARQREVQIKDFSQKKKKELIKEYLKQGGQFFYPD